MKFDPFSWQAAQGNVDNLLLGLSKTIVSIKEAP
jgi:hypothetical protein